jgi:cell division protein FtsW (lipid II flippase)
MKTSRRTKELLLLVLVLVVSRLGLFLVEQATQYSAPVSDAVVVGIATLVLLGHGAIRWLAPAADPLIYPIAVQLNLLGLIMIHRLDVADLLREQLGTAPVAEAPSQTIWLALGIFLAAATLWLVRDHRQLQRYTFTAMVFGFALLLLPLVPGLGATVNGARLWIRIAGLSFQPAEVAKIALPVFFASYLAKNRASMNAIRSRWLGIGVPRAKDTGPIVLAWLLSLLVLISQRDLGTSLLFFGLFVGLLYIATGQRTWLVIGAILFSSGAYLAYKLFGHVQLRVMVWLDPFAYAHDQGYQLVQAIYGFASGGLFGRGLGQGFSWLVPYAKSDFILSAFGEELGYVGLIAIAMLFGLLVQRALKIALTTRDDFGQLLSAGLALVLGLQMFVVFGGVTRLIPLTGLTTPFLAAGGSALIANWIMVGLLLRISHTSTMLNAPAGDVR